MNGFTRYAVRLAACLAVATLYPLSMLVPRRRNLWLVGGIGTGFQGNAKYFFLWMRANRPDIDLIWITSSPDTVARLEAHGLPVAYRWSIAGIAAALRAAVYVFDSRPSDVNLYLGGGSLQVNLFHAVTIVNFDFELKTLPERNRAVFLNPGSQINRLANFHVYRKPDILVTTSDWVQSHMAKCFQVPVKRCPQLGTPRLDPSADEKLRQIAFGMDDYDPVLRTIDRYEEVYVYLPTLRERNTRFMETVLPDLGRLSSALAARGAFLYLKFHPRSVGADFHVPAAVENIELLPTALDIYPILDRINLISDYSSIIYDYLAIRDRGLIVYDFDYAAWSREFADCALRYDDNIIGVRASRFEDLCDAIRSGDALKPFPEGKLAELRDRFWSGGKPPSSVRIAQYIEQRLQNSVRSGFKHAALDDRA